MSFYGQSHVIKEKAASHGIPQATVIDIYNKHFPYGEPYPLSDIMFLANVFNEKETAEISLRKANKKYRAQLQELQGIPKVEQAESVRKAFLDEVANATLRYAEASEEIARLQHETAFEHLTNELKMKNAENESQAEIIKVQNTEINKLNSRLKHKDNDLSQKTESHKQYKRTFGKENIALQNELEKANQEIVRLKGIIAQSQINATQSSNLQQGPGSQAQRSAKRSADGLGHNSAKRGRFE